MQTYKTEYRAFTDAKSRCNNPNHPRYNDWGGRGIKVNYSCFEEFLSDVGVKPDNSFVLDRINNDGHYEVGNVRWVSKSMSQLNKRAPKHSPFKFAGVRQVISKGLITPTYQAYCNILGKFKQLYSGPDLEKAIQARKDWNGRKV
jgi:hypothetical protein